MSSKKIVDLPETVVHHQFDDLAVEVIHGAQVQLFLVLAIEEQEALGHSRCPGYVVSGGVLVGMSAECLHRRAHHGLLALRVQLLEGVVERCEEGMIHGTPWGYSVSVPS